MQEKTNKKQRENKQKKDQQQRTKTNSVGTGEEE